MRTRFYSTFVSILENSKLYNLLVINTEYLFLLPILYTLLLLVYILQYIKVLIYHVKWGELEDVLVIDHIIDISFLNKVSRIEFSSPLKSECQNLVKFSIFFLVPVHWNFLWCISMDYRNYRMTYSNGFYYKMKCLYVETSISYSSNKIFFSIIEKLENLKKGR